MDTPQTLPVLDAAELRVLGSIIEKSRTTPDYYPMTLNGLTTACNQKTSRNPVVQYEEVTVHFLSCRDCVVPRNDVMG